MRLEREICGLTDVVRKYVQSKASQTREDFRILLLFQVVKNTNHYNILLQHDLSVFTFTLRRDVETEKQAGEPADTYWVMIEKILFDFS